MNVPGGVLNGILLVLIIRSNFGGGNSCPSVTQVTAKAEQSKGEKRKREEKCIFPMKCVKSLDLDVF